MEPKTNTANTKDWLEASRNINISAYIESYTITLNMLEKPFSSGGLYDALVSVSVPLAEQDYEFRKEFRAWDALSDEALMLLERELN